MTVQMCLSICAKKGFRYSGLEWGYECYCGDEESDYFQWTWPDLCDNQCTGDSTQICGGSNALSLYSTPIYREGLCAYDYPGSRRVLNDYSVTGDKNMTIEKCGLICSGHGK